MKYMAYTCFVVSLINMKLVDAQMKVFAFSPLVANIKLNPQAFLEKVRRSVFEAVVPIDVPDAVATIVAEGLSGVDRAI